MVSQSRVTTHCLFELYTCLHTTTLMPLTLKEKFIDLVYKLLQKVINSYQWSFKSIRESQNVFHNLITTEIFLTHRSGHVQIH